MQVRGRKCNESGHRLWSGDPKRNCPGLLRGSDEWRRVFDSSVSEEEHLQYHSNHKGFCIRCDVQKRPKVYLAQSLHKGRAWLSRGVSRGKWGPGCILYAKTLKSGLKSKGQRFSSFPNSSFDRHQCIIARRREMGISHPSRIVWLAGSIETGLL